MNDKFAKVFDTKDGGQVVVYLRWSDEEFPAPMLTTLTRVDGSLQEGNLYWNSDDDGVAKAAKAFEQFSAKRAEEFREKIVAAVRESTE